MSNKANRAKAGSGGPTGPAPASAPASGPASSGGKGFTPSANAWARPLQQNTRSKMTAGGSPAGTPGPPPGLRSAGNGNGASASGSASTTNKSAPPAASAPPSANDTLAMQMRERFLQLSLTMVGQPVTLTQTNGSVLEGTFHTFTPFSSQMPAHMRNVYVVKACRSVKGPSESGAEPALVDEASATGKKQRDFATVEKEGCTVIVPAERVASVHIKSMRLDVPPPALNGTANEASPAQKSAWGNAGAADFSMRTDTDISGMRGGKGRGLVAAGSAWTSAGDSASQSGLSSRADAMRGGPAAGGSNSASGGPAGGLRGNIGQWDQFSANEKLFNVKASYDENLYTTELDKSGIEAHKLAEAERLAKEIEGSVSTNIHIAEERGQTIQGDYDEEDLYSGVLTSEGKARTAGPATSESSADKSKAETKAKAPKKVMNYAAAAAKPGPAGTAPVLPPGMNIKTSPKAPPSPSAAKVVPSALKKSDDKTTGATDAKAASGEGVEKQKASETATLDKTATETAKSTEEPAEKDEEKKETTEAKKTSTKLNVKAKEFVFNPGARTFTPVAPSVSTADQQFGTDPSTGMLGFNGPGPHAQGQPHYMQHPGHMGQPGMVPMMNSQFAMRYPGANPYAGMAQQALPMQTPQQAQHMQPTQTPQPPQDQEATGSAAASAAASTTSSGESAEPAQPSTTDQSQPQQPLQQQQQGGVPMPYGVPPGAYYGGGMGMHPNARAPPMGNFHPQMVMPGGNPYRPMYGGGPMQQPGMMPNMPQMRGPGGAAPYYPGAPGGMHYPPNSGYGGNMPGQGNMEEGDHGYRGGRGNPGGRGGRGRRNKRAPSGGGRGGRSSYHNNNSHQQNNPGNQNQQGEVDGSSNKLQEVKNDGGGTEKVTSSTPANAASD